MQPNNLVVVKYDELKHTTPTAFKVKFGDGASDTDKLELWIPRSICDLDKAEKTVTIPEWYAVDKGLINQVPDQDDKPTPPEAA